MSRNKVQKGIKQRFSEDCEINVEIIKRYKKIHI